MGFQQGLPQQREQHPPYFHYNWPILGVNIYFFNTALFIYVYLYFRCDHVKGCIFNTATPVKNTTDIFVEGNF